MAMITTIHIYWSLSSTSGDGFKTRQLLEYIIRSNPLHTLSLYGSLCSRQTSDGCGSEIDKYIFSESYDQRLSDFDFLCQTSFNLFLTNLIFCYCWSLEERLTIQWKCFVRAVHCTMCTLVSFFPLDRARSDIS